jgi:hypothetical protein
MIVERRTELTTDMVAALLRKEGASIPEDAAVTLKIRTTKIKGEEGTPDSVAQRLEVTWPDSTK